MGGSLEMMFLSSAVNFISKHEPISINGVSFYLPHNHTSCVC
jgi:hypothetical protein